MPNYDVVVHNVSGYSTLDVGMVTEEDHTHARLAALSKYGEEGLRPTEYRPDRPLRAIYEDDDFDVRLHM